MMRRYIEWEWYQRQVKKMHERHPDVYMPTEGIPFADVRENVKGEWIDENCSVCGQYVYHGDAGNFCPECGADMRGEEE